MLRDIPEIRIGGGASPFGIGACDDDGVGAHSESNMVLGLWTLNWFLPSRFRCGWFGANTVGLLWHLCIEAHSRTAFSNFGSIWPSDFSQFSPSMSQAEESRAYVEFVT